MALRFATTACALLVMIACSSPAPPEESGEPSAGKTSAGPAVASHAWSSGGEASADREGEKLILCEHQVPADQCTKCNPDLIDAFKELGDWCDEHGLPKSHDKECNPALTFHAGPPKDWCKEHAVPESMCTKCNPALVAKFIQADDYCREHGYPASVCPIHHPELVAAAGEEPPVFPEPGTLVRLASARTGEDVGLQTVQVQTRQFARAIEVAGQLEFNQNRLARLSARGEALIVDVKVDVGDEVAADQPLIALASAAVGSSQANLTAAEARLRATRAAVQREKGLVEKGVSPRKNLEAAEAELASAEAEFGAAKAGLTAAGASPAGTGGRYVLTAPFAGTVVARDAVIGRSAAPGDVLIELADISVMWAELDVPETEASLVKRGQPVLLTFEGSTSRSLDSTITRVGASVDPSTRTVSARVELPNPDGSLKAGTFVRARIQVTENHEARLVPRESIQKAEGRSLVFVKKEAGLFEPVAVELGAENAGMVEVVSALPPGADIVTTGAFLLKTEILKESIGAGCCEEGPE